MADETPTAPDFVAQPDGSPADGPQAAAIAQYIKDLSVESPNAPTVFQWQVQPAVDVQFNINVDRVADDVHEVVLRINVAAKSDQGTHFLVDLSYAGLFGLRNFPDEALAPFMLVEAPNLIFPFARQIIAEAVQNTGFPPLLLEPIDFGRAFMATMENAQAQADAVPQANGGGDAVGSPAPSALPEGFDPALTDSDPADPDPSKGMNLYKAIGSIGGLTMVSRVLGFVRDMIGSRLLGASHANDAFNLAFLLPNIFRRLFAEGAFSSGFVPLFSRRLQSGGPDDAEAFSNEILAVFMPALLLVTIVFVIFMPGIMLVVAPGYQDVPGKLELATTLTRWTFPYLLFISLVAFLSGVLNSLTKFAIAAFAPALLNVALIVGLLISPPDKVETVRNMAYAVLVGGVFQFLLCWVAVRRAGVRLRFGRPRMTPAVRELVVLILPATLAAGVYQISQLFYAYFSTQLGEGALTNLSYADRLNQLPLSIIGTALGVAILPSISQAIARDDEVEAADVQARAFDLSMLLTLPATIALAVAAGPIIGALYQGGEYSVEAARITGNILAILVTGLPAYVLVKVLTPAFYARKDVKTPVRIAMGVLAGGVVANFALIEVMGIYALATVTSASAWINFLALFSILYWRGHFRMPGWLVSRVVRQFIAAAAMGAALYGVNRLLGDMYYGDTVEKIVSLGALVGTGGLVYFAVAWAIGGIDREAILILLRKKKVTD